MNYFSLVYVELTAVLAELVVDVTNVIRASNSENYDLVPLL